MTMPMPEAERQILHYVTAALPLLYVACLLLRRHWLRSASVPMGGGLYVIRDEVTVKPADGLVLRNLIWPGTGLLQVGEQVLGWVCAVFHFLFLADVLLEAGLWRWLATGGAVLNLIVTTTVLQSILDAGRANRVVQVLRFRSP